MNDNNDTVDKRRELEMKCYYKLRCSESGMVLLENGFGFVGNTL